MTSFQKENISLPPISLVIFDFDGVLVNTQETVNRIQWEFLGRQGYTLSLEEFHERFTGSTTPSIVEQLKKENLSFPENLAEEIDEAIFSEFSQKGIDPIPGMTHLLQLLPFKKCIASNCPAHILEALVSASGLKAYFGASVFSADFVARPKPNPDVYLYAAYQMGEVPEMCVVIEDSEIGVRAAKAAGMTVLGFLGGSHTLSSPREKLLKAGASFVFNTPEDLIDFFQLENPFKTATIRK